MKLELTAFDTLFFRDGKPFSKGNETWADAIFPPYPATIYGALRTAYFNANPQVFSELKENDKLNSNADPTKKLKINNIFIKNENGYLFQTPRNILKKANSNDLEILSEFDTNSLSNYSASQILKSSGEKAEYKKSQLSNINFEDYLNAMYGNIQILKNPITTSEPKVGIAIDQTTGTSQDEHLFRVDLIRPNIELKIIVDCEGLELENEILLKLGGEGKFAFAKAKEETINIAMPEIDTKFLIYLNTPAIFRKGWLPDWIDEASLIGEIPNTNLKIKFFSCVIGKPEFIGGFDMAKVAPKPMFKAVPAGSVYFCEIMDGNPAELEVIHQRSISDIFPEQGFGICYIGKLKEEK
jgi:CRISPR-associated protein Cmr3